MKPSSGIMLFGLLLVLLLLYGEPAFFILYSLLAVLLIYLAVKITGWFIGFLAEFVQTESPEVEKSHGTEPLGKDIEDILEDALETLLNLNKPKGNLTKRIGEGTEEFLEKGSKLFKN